MRLILAVLTLAMAAGRLFAADYTTYIGDTNEYRVAAITTDTAGNTYVTGSRLLSAHQNRLHFHNPPIPKLSVLNFGRKERSVGHRGTQWRSVGSPHNFSESLGSTLDSDHGKGE